MSESTNIDRILAQAPCERTRSATGNATKRAVKTDVLSRRLLSSIFNERHRRNKLHGVTPRSMYDDTEEERVQRELREFGAFSDHERMEAFHDRNASNARNDQWRTLPIKDRRAMLCEYINENPRIAVYQKPHLIHDIMRRNELLSDRSIKYSRKTGKVISFDTSRLLS